MDGFKYLYFSSHINKYLLKYPLKPSSSQTNKSVAGRTRGYKKSLTISHRVSLNPIPISTKWKE